jgi:hypothetical protein
VAVFKRRPRLSLIAPRLIAAGSEVDLIAIVECSSPVTVRAIDLEVIGRAVRISHGQYGEERARTDFYRSGTKVFDGGDLAPGRREIPVRVRLPPGLPGSYRGKHVQIEYIAAIAVDIPWWPDKKAGFELFVAGATSPARPRPTVMYSSADGPGTRGPYFELALPTTELSPGARLEIAASFSNLEHARYRSLELELVALESSKTFLAGGTRERSAARWVVQLDRLREGEPVRSGIMVPYDVPPAFDVETIRLSWMLRARARVAWGRDAVVEVPVTVHPGMPALGAMRAPPEVGSERVAELWRQVGEAAGLALQDGVLVGQVGGARLTVRRELSGRRGPHLVGELGFPDLRIGFQLEGRRRAPTARDPRHARILAEALAGPLGDAGAVEASDREIRCVTRGSGVRRASLAGFIRAVSGLARELETTRAALPPPARFEQEIDAWRASSARLGAQLEAAGPSMTGSSGGTPFEIGAGWSDDGEPDSLEIELAAATPIDRRHHIEWQEWQPRPGDEAVAALCDSARALEIDRGGLRIRYSRELGPDGAAAQLPGLAALVRNLSAPPAGGVYR